ncbi:hypothetical protein [Halomonas saccharevitans]|uniref:Uncharacterized protein n=1 Tax=Halomonas saccharevitans TaxID=416872 RepID=A0A1I7AGF6_9GAMM|nr:hypothetical protein [Halomonas saccharevitans]SFT74016.1 hypothetical protein SAMN04487956_11764 [Halomonas saccharevitans]
MTIVAAMLLIAVGGYALVQGFRDDWMFQTLWRGIALFCLLLVVLILAGCASAPAPPPEPPPRAVVCAPGPGMTEDEASPDKPAGEYTQRDVARYMAEVHQWGSRGWKKLARVRQWSRDCVDRAAVRDGGRAE